MGADGQDIGIGDVVDVPGGMHGVVKFIGAVSNKKGVFAGVELSREYASRGKNDGEVDGWVLEHDAGGAHIDGRTVNSTFEPLCLAQAYSSLYIVRRNAPQRHQTTSLLLLPRHPTTVTSVYRQPPNPTSAQTHHRYPSSRSLLVLELERLVRSSSQKADHLSLDPNRRFASPP
jgi:hypothetical protein